MEMRLQLFGARRCDMEPPGDPFPSSQALSRVNVDEPFMREFKQ